MDDPNALETAAEQLQKVAHTFQTTIGKLQNTNLQLSQASFQLMGSWNGQSATAFQDACTHIQQTSNKCMTGLDQAISSCQGAAGHIENALPTLRSAHSASQQAESGGLNEGLLKAIEAGNKAESDLTSYIGTMAQALDAATEALGKCEAQEPGGAESGGEDPFFDKLKDIAKDDLKDAVQEALIDRLKELVKEWQKNQAAKLKL